MKARYQCVRVNLGVNKPCIGEASLAICFRDDHIENSQPNPGVTEVSCHVLVHRQCGGGGGV